MGRKYQPTAAQQAEAEARRSELLGKLAEGVDKLVDSGEWQRYLDCQSKFHHYSFNNCLLILSQRPDATQVNSFKRWQELGRNVSKGESSIRIFAPSLRKQEVETENGTEEVRKLSGFRLVPVFDISQTSGEELPEPAKLLGGEAPEGLFAKMTTVAQGCGFKVKLTPQIEGFGDANGVCRHDQKLIEVATEGRGELQQVKTLAHEIGHALLHNPNDQIGRNTRDLEAESTAYVVCASLGLDTSDYSLGYVADWSGGDAEKTREAIKASGGRVHQASQKILDGLELQAIKSEPEYDEPKLEVA